MPYGYNGLIGLIVLIADIYAIISILGSGAPPLHKVLWILLILLLPLIGAIIWYFAGPRGNRLMA